MTQPAPVPKRPPPALVAPATPTVPTGPSRMSLKNKTSGLIRGEALRILVHGVEGVGKSTFGANAPRPIFLGAEDGSAELDVDRFPQPTSWTDALEAIDALTNEPHEHATLVVDSLDWLEPMCWAYVCKKGSKESIEGFGYGKGYIAALDEWRVFLARLGLLREKRKMNVIFIAHSVLKSFKNPDANQGDYDRYQLKLHDKAGGLFKEWSKAVLFANYERATVEKDGRHRGMDTGRRMLYTRMTAAYDGKNRLGLPAEIPLSWTAFAKAAKAGEDLRIALAEALAKVDVQTRDQAKAWIEEQQFDPAAIASATAALVAKVNGSPTPEKTETTTKEVSK